MRTEPQPTFLGGPDRRWYLVSEIEKTAKQVDIIRRQMEMVKEEERREMEEKKEKAKKEKEGKAAGAAETKRKRGSEVEQRGVEENNEDEGDEEVVKPVKRGRGRPPKEKSAVAVAVAAKTKTKKSVAGVNADGTAKRGRGRPPKAKKPRLVKSEPDSGFAEGISFQEGTKTKNHVSSSHT